MNNIERDNLNEMLRQIELYIPPSHQGKFGMWDNFKTFVENLDGDDNKICDLERNIRRADSKIEQLENQVREIRSAIDDIVDDLKILDIGEVLENTDSIEYEELLKKLEDMI